MLVGSQKQVAPEVIWLFSTIFLQKHEFTFQKDIQNTKKYLMLISLSGQESSSIGLFLSHFIRERKDHLFGWNYNFTRSLCAKIHLWAKIRKELYSIV